MTYPALIKNDEMDSFNPIVRFEIPDDGIYYEQRMAIIKFLHIT